MQTATSSVEISFNNTMDRQIDGVAMSSPLGPSLANIFVRYYEALLFKRVNKPLMYYRYIDDNFAAFNDEDKCNEFFSHLISLHPSFCFTFEKKCNRTLPFFDVLVEKTITNLLHLSTESRLSLANTFAGTIFAPSNERPI